MATVTPTFDVLPGNRFNIVWSSMAAGDVGDPVEVSNSQWRAIGIASASGAASLQVSNDGATWSVITGFGSPTVVDIVSRARYLQPIADVGNAGNIDIVLHCSN